MIFSLCFTWKLSRSFDWSSICAVPERSQIFFYIYSLQSLLYLTDLTDFVWSSISAVPERSQIFIWSSVSALPERSHRVCMIFSPCFTWKISEIFIWSSVCAGPEDLTDFYMTLNLCFTQKISQVFMQFFQVLSWAWSCWSIQSLWQHMADRLAHESSVCWTVCQQPQQR